MKLSKGIISSVTIIAFSLFFITNNASATIQVKKYNEEKKNYIVSTDKIEGIEKQYELSDTINTNGQNNLQENDLVSVHMTEDEAEKLEKKSDVQFVEEDVIVQASAKNNPFHKKKEKRIKKNNSNIEWNMQMIHGAKKAKKRRKKVKIAVLDSGVDYGNDIELAETITLVPGEEEMSPLFMDGTGHGNSVAGLIAAIDNGEGITGVNPNAEIYSIRVLDDNNCAPVSRVIEGIYMAIDKEVNIINMSFGVNSYSEALAKAVRDASDRGILIIAAAGNTAVKGVQYPAAFDEVMAVGSVDKNGNLASDSAIGKEVEIVAPGELVRCTGVLGDQLVASGTSLAASQIAGVASLIWEKDMNVSADFVRDLLNESANSYGEQEKYGNGLVDAQYALENYDLYKKNYKKKKKSNKLPKNEEKIITFEETGCVAGSWSSSDHAEFIPSQNTNVKKGARFNDKKIHQEGVFDNEKKTIMWRYAGIWHNPWWHGYWKKVKKNLTKEYDINYVASYIYLTKLANNISNYKNVGRPSTLPSMVENEIKSDISYIPWTSSDALNKSNPTNGDKRAFVWGMALHSLADCFAHNTYITIRGKNYPITHDGEYPYADTITYKEERYQHAFLAVRSAMEKYNNSSHPNGTYKDFLPLSKATQYKMGGIVNCVYDVAGSSAASYFANVHCSTK